MRPTALAWHGSLPRKGDVPWDEAQPRIRTSQVTIANTAAAPTDAESPYRARFRQGAILVPRMVLFVTTRHAGPFGAGAGRTPVKSRRSNQEKPPYKTMPSLAGTVEDQFIRDVHLGETIAPYRTLPPLQAVIPVDANHILTPDEIDDHDGLSHWWADVESAWEAGRKSSETQALPTHFDYHQQPSSQLPVPPHRVVYSKAGTTLAAARLDNPQAVIDHKLYWAAVDNPDEGRYLVAILNSTTLLQRVQPLQTRGLMGPRDFDKYVFHIPFPTYDPNNSHHRTLVTLGSSPW